MLQLCCMRRPKSYLFTVNSKTGVIKIDNLLLTQLVAKVVCFIGMDTACYGHCMLWTLHAMDTAIQSAIQIMYGTLIPIRNVKIFA